jgi:hypothetical protein
MNFYRVAKPSTYYWEFLARWGQECYRSWRHEIALAVVLSLLTYLVSLGDNGALKSTEVTLEANLLLFLIFVLIHLIRTPYLLHRDRTHPIEGGIPYVGRGFGIFGIALILVLAGCASYGIYDLWLHEAPIIALISKTPPPPSFTEPAITALRRNAPSDVGSSLGKIPPKTAEPKPLPLATVAQAPIQPPQASQSQPPVTFLDRVVRENRGLTPDDRNRLSTELYEADQFIEQSRGVGYKLSTEFSKISNERQNGALAKDVDDQIKVLRDLDAPAWDEYHGLQRFQDKWKYFPDQTEYIFGDNPFNAGEGVLINTAEGMANSLTWWSKISNRDQQDILNIEAQPLEDFQKQLRQFFDWAEGTLARIKQMRQSLDPNGVVQPIPNSTSAPAPAMFTAN